MTLPDIEYSFIGYDKGSRLRNYKNNYYYIVPKYSLYINHNTFAYTNSHNSLKQYLKKKFSLSTELSLVYNDKRDILVNWKNYVGPASSFIGTDNFPFFRLNELPRSILLLPTELAEAFSCIVRDALIPVEYDMDSFIEEFFDRSSCSIQQVRDLEDTYRECVRIRKNLGIPDSRLKEYDEYFSTL
jgi:hypothetical protein